MPAPLPLPVRVLVKGPSTVNWTSWMGGPRTDLTFPRVIEATLAEQGYPSQVQAITMTSEQAKKILGTWQREVLGFSPDVIVLAYGHFDSVHLFLPRWLERHANSLKVKPGRLRGFYRRRVLRPVWISLAKLQARLDAIPALQLLDRRSERVAGYVERYIEHVQKVGSPLVFVFELVPPASKQRTWFPGMTPRIAAFNKAIEEVVARIDKPHVRVFRIPPLVERLYGGDIEAATPDGFHYTPELHRAIGESLAAEIQRWAATQPHLAYDAPSAQ